MVRKYRNACEVSLVERFHQAAFRQPPNKQGELTFRRTA